MLSAFIIVLRECAELLLICLALRAALRTASPEGQTVWIALGAASGVLSGFWLASFIASWRDSAPVMAVITMLLAVSALIMTTGMLASDRQINKRTHAFVSAWLPQGMGAFVACALGSLAGLRESMEVAFFLRAVLIEQGAAEVRLGVTAALVTIALLAIPWMWVRARISVLAAFRASAVLLAVLTIDLLLQGMSQLLRAWPALANHELLRNSLTPLLHGGPWHAWLILALLIFPALQLLRTWWVESR